MIEPAPAPVEAPEVPPSPAEAAALELVREAMYRLIPVLDGPELAVELPAVIPDDLAAVLSVGRVLVKVERGHVAVRPDRECKACRGSTAYRFRRGGTREFPCECVTRRLKGDAPPIATSPEPAASPAAPAAPSGVDRRAEAFARRIADAEERLAERERARDAALAEVTGRIAAATPALMDAARELEQANSSRIARVENGARLQREIEELRQAIAVREGLVRENTAAIATLDRATIPPLERRSKEAEEAIAEVRAQRDRVAAHHDRRLQPLHSELARLRRRAGG